LKQRYGRIFIDSLPAYKKTKDIAEAEQFFAGAQQHGTLSGLTDH
jgi:hypothetical protein